MLTFGSSERNAYWKRADSFWRPDNKQKINWEISYDLVNSWKYEVGFVVVWIFSCSFDRSFVCFSDYFFVFGGIFKECSVKKSLFRLFTWDGCEDKFHHGYPKLLLRGTSVPYANYVTEYCIGKEVAFRDRKRAGLTPEIANLLRVRELSYKKIYI